MPMPHPHRESLYRQVQEFDGYLQKPYLKTLTLEDAARILKKMEAFHHQADGLRQQPQYSLENDYLIAVGCRLTADLLEQILMRVMDIYQAGDHTLTRLYQQFQGQIRQ